MELITPLLENEEEFLNMIEERLIEKEEVLFSINNKTIHICKSVDNKGYAVNLFKTKNIFKEEKIDFSLAIKGCIASNPLLAVNILL